MRPLATAAVKALVVAGATAGVVVGTGQLSTPVVLGATAPAAAQPTPEVVPVRQVTLGCPGPESEGIPSVPAVPGGRFGVVATTAPLQALSGLATAPGPGALTLTAAQGGPPLASTGQRAQSVAGSVDGPTPVLVSGSGSLAPGTAAVQTWLKSDTADRGLVVTPCLAPRAETWLLAGGAETTRRERLVVANPGANTVTVDVEVFGSAGRLRVGGGARLAVPPHGRVGVLLDGLVAQEARPAIRLTATGGLVTAVVEDSWIAGTVSHGRDDSGPADPPATEVVVPAVLAAGPAVLRVVVPGEQEAVVQARLLTTEGPRPVPGDEVLRVGAHSVRDIDLSGLPVGTYAVQVRADRPVTAAVRVERAATQAGGPADFGWVAAAAPIPVLAGTPLPPAGESWLALVGTGADWSASVVVVAADGTSTTRTVTGVADSTQDLFVADAQAVWVRPTAGTLRAGVFHQVRAAEGPLVSTWALAPAAVTATDVPVAEIRR